MYMDGGGKSKDGNKAAHGVTRCAQRPRTSRAKAVRSAPTGGYIRPYMQNTFQSTSLNPHGPANINGLH